MKGKKLQGETQNLKSHVKEELTALYELTVPVGQLSTKELNERLIAVTEEIGREVAVYVDRKGRRQHVDGRSARRRCPLGGAPFGRALHPYASERRYGA